MCPICWAQIFWVTRRSSSFGSEFIFPIKSAMIFLNINKFILFYICSIIFEKRFSEKIELLEGGTIDITNYTFRLNNTLIK